jgi:O-antigen/teichoic acid export membrane protein
MAKGAGIVFAGSIISFGLRYFFQVLVARQIGPELFGIFSLAVSVFGVAEVIAVLGMQKGMVRFVALHQSEGDTRRLKGTIRLGSVFDLGGGIAVALAVVLGSGTLGTAVFHTSILPRVLRAFAIAVPFTALTGVLLAATQGMKIMRYRVYVRDILEQVSRVVLVIILFSLGLRLWAASSAFIAALILGTVASTVFYRRVFRAVLRNDAAQIAEAKRLLTYCWPLLFANCFAIVEAWLAIFMLGYFRTPEAVGIFSAAYRTSFLTQGILLAFNTMFSPIISDLHHTQQHDRLRTLLKMVTKWIFSLNLPIILVMVFLSREVLWIFGKEYVTGAACLVVLGIGQFMQSAPGPLGILIDMSGRPKITLFNSVAVLLFQTVLCIVLIPKNGIMGAAVAKTASLGFLRALQLYEVRSVLRMHPFRRDFFKPLVAGTAAIVVVTLLKSPLAQVEAPFLRLLAGALILVVTYTIVLYTLGISEEDREILGKIKEKLPV